MTKRLVALVITIVVLGFATRLAGLDLASAGQLIVVEIPAGASTTEIGRILDDAGVIDNAWFFRLYTKLAGVQGSLKAGHYEFEGKPSYRQLVRTLVEGRPEMVIVTVREGLTLDEVALVLEQAGIVKASEFLRLAHDPAYTLGNEMPEWLYGARSLEGYLFPDTYRFAPGQSVREVILTMFRQFQAKVRPLLSHSQIVAKFGVQDWVTLASIVEKEGRLRDEFPVIASVFVNRLQREMYLQSCATVQYALGERKQILSEQDLKVESPYNTYKYAGLPPGPIASPGLAALTAAAKPEDTKYLYFVAKGDGSHAFSTTYSGHLAAKKKYESRAK